MLLRFKPALDPMIECYNPYKTKWPKPQTNPLGGEDSINASWDSRVLVVYVKFVRASSWLGVGGR